MGSAEPAAPAAPVVLIPTARADPGLPGQTGSVHRPTSPKVEGDALPLSFTVVGLGILLLLCMAARRGAPTRGGVGSSRLGSGFPSVIGAHPPPVVGLARSPRARNGATPQRLPRCGRRRGAIGARQPRASPAFRGWPFPAAPSSTSPP